MSKRYSAKIVNVITKFLLEDDWHYQFDEENGTYKMGLGLEGELNHVDIYIHVYDNSFTVSMVSPINVKKDPAKRKEMAEFICRANYGLEYGGFQYDIRDGEILYKVCVSCHDIVPSQEMVRHSLYIPAMLFNQYSEGMFAVLFGGFNAKDAVDACEKRSDKTAEIIEALEAAAESGDSDICDMLTHLAIKFGFTNDDEGAAESGTYTEETRSVRPNPFLGER